MEDISWFEWVELMMKYKYGEKEDEEDLDEELQRILDELDFELK